MKNNSIQTLIAGAAIAAVLFLGPVAKAGTISLNPSSTDVTVGSDFKVNVVASDVNLGGYALTIGFQPLLTSLTLIEFSNGLGAPMSFQYGQDNVDQIEVDEVSFADGSVLLTLQGDAAVGNSFPLVTLSFAAQNPGTANFQFLYDDLTDFVGSPVTATLTGTTVTIKSSGSNGGSGGGPTGAVPEPATGSLMIGSLGVLFYLVRRKQRT